MNRKRVTAALFAVLIVTSGTAAALQGTVWDEYDTGNELDNAVGATSIEYADGAANSVIEGGFTDPYDDGNLSEYSTASNFAVNQLSGGDYVAQTSPAESATLVRSGDTVGDYGTYSVSDKISDDSLTPYSVDSSWSSKGTVGSNATVNSNNNLELADTDQYTGTSFTLSDDSTVDSVDVTVSSVGATVKVKLQHYDGSAWSTVNSKSISSTGTVSMSTSQGSGEYRIKLVAQGDSTTATVIDSTTTHGTDPAEALTLSAVDVAGTSSDKTDDVGLKLKVTPSGNLTLTRYDNSAGSSTTLVTGSVSDVSKEHKYSVTRQADGDLAVFVDGTEVGTHDVSSVKADSIDNIVVTAGNGHTVDDLNAPADSEFVYYSDRFTDVKNAQEGFARLDVAPGSQVTVEVYAVASDGTMYLVDTQTVTVSSGESSISKAISASAVNSEYQKYEVDVVGHGDVSIRSVGMTYEDTSSGVIGTVEDSASGNMFYIIAIGGVALLLALSRFKN